jgi:hypothetical protein
VIARLLSSLRRRPAPVLRAPMNDDRVRELQRVIAEKRAAAIAELGDRWLLHPRNRIR